MVITILGNNYDRGHLVPANHLDHLAKGIAQSNYMTNILPQHAKMNRGAWLVTEEIIECTRDEEPLHVVGGPIWHTKKSDSRMIDLHSVEIPKVGAA
jgi:endonuclease G